MNDFDDWILDDSKEAIIYSPKSSKIEKIKALKDKIESAQALEKKKILFQYIQVIAKNDKNFSIQDILSIIDSYKHLNINYLDILYTVKTWGRYHYAVKYLCDKIGFRLHEKITVKKENDSPIRDTKLRSWGILEGQHLIDEVLGKYDPDKQEIILYIENIKTSASYLSVNENVLARLVELHEAAHAIIHLGIDTDGINFNTNCYKGVDRGKFPSPLHETLAQLICYHCVKDDSLQSDCFEKLNRCQPTEYRLWEEFKDVSLERIRNILVEIRQQRIGASFEVFKARVLG